MAAICLEAYSRSCVAAQRLTLAILGLADLVIEVSDEQARNLARIAPQARIRVLRNCVSWRLYGCERRIALVRKCVLSFSARLGQVRGV